MECSQDSKDYKVVFQESGTEIKYIILMVRAVLHTIILVTELSSQELQFLILSELHWVCGVSQRFLVFL